MLKLLLFILLNLLSQLAVGQIRIESVIWHTPNDWDRLVNKSGVGLYIDIVDAVFKPKGIKVNRETMPWKRSLHDVLEGEADFTGGQSPMKEYYMSREPLFQGWEMIFAKKKSILYPALSNLKSRRGVWVRGYTDGFQDEIKNKIRGGEVASREQALKMVLMGRADYYLDNRIQMSHLLGKTPFTKIDYGCYELFEAKVYMAFTRSPRGLKIREMYDKGIELLTESGELRKIYDKWHFPFPDAKERAPATDESCAER